MRTRILHYCFVLGIAISGASANAVEVIFSDATFSDADWTATVVQSTGPTPEFTAGQIASDGNPGSYRQTSQSLGGAGSVLVGHVFEAMSYDPAVSGAILSVDVAFDLLLIDGGDPTGVAYGLYLDQDGRRFIGADALTTIEPVTGIWESNSSTSLVASDFRPRSGTQGLPDFSETGALIQFGFFTSNGTAANQRTTTISGIDNWVVTLETAPVVVPLPAGAILLGVPLAALLRRRSVARAATD